MADKESNFGGARVDEMLPPEDVAALIEKMSPPDRTGSTARRRSVASGFRFHLSQFEGVNNTGGEIDG